MTDDGLHPPLEDLVDRAADPEIQRHLADCPECRIALRVFADARAADPSDLPEFDEARDRLDAAQREASASMSRSLGGTQGDAADELRPGQVVERYVVEALIGKGGMGAVYRVRHQRLGGVHALKVLQYASRSVRSRLIREGRAQSGLRHANIVAVTDVVDVDGAPGLIMEFIDGPSLGQWLQDHGRPSIREADALAQGIIRGLAAAHRAGLIHRDLKPANILLAQGEDGLVPKIADFGLSRFVEEGATDTRLTRSDTPMGTPSYMAPEQITDASRADARSDLFSLGAVLYELVTGQRAFVGANVVEIYNRVHEGRYAPPRDLVPSLPGRMAQTIERALRVDPVGRFADCRSLLESWSGVAVPDSIVPPPPTASRPPRAWWVAGAGVLGLAAAAAAVDWLVGPPEPLPPAGPTARSERRLTSTEYFKIISSYALSRDGRDIAWCGTPPEGFVHMAVDGGSPTVLMPDACPQDFFSDGKRILAGKHRAPPNVDADTPWEHVPFELWVAGPDGSIEPFAEVPSIPLDEGSWYSELSPDDRRFAWSAKAGPWVYSFDTRSAARLRPLERADATRAIEWSPSGKYLAAIHSNNDEAWLEITAADGSSSRRVLTDPRLGTVSPANLQWEPPIWGANLAWLEPDRLVYGLVDDRVSPIETTLYVVDDASTATDFANAPVFERLSDGYVMDLTASADGSRLVYFRQPAWADIWVAPLDDPGSAVPITQEDWDEVPIGWTAAGDVVFASERSGHQDLFTQPLETVPPTPLSTDPAREWAGDVHGDAVLWWKADTDASGVQTGQVLMRAVPGGGEAVPVLRLSLGDYTIRCPASAEHRCLVGRHVGRSTEFQWLDPKAGELGPRLLDLTTGPGVTGWDLSPDGTRLAVVSYMGDSSLRADQVPAELVIRDLEGGGIVRHRLEHVRSHELAWAPSGDELYLSGFWLSDERYVIHAPSVIWSVGLDGTMQLVWAPEMRLMSDPTPSPDGKWLAARVTDFGSPDLWLLERSP